MSAELYDAEMAGALARPSVDVLPQQSRKTKGPDVPPAGPEAPADPVGVPVEAAAPVTDPADSHALVADPVQGAPFAAEPVTDEAPAPRKVFGMALTRGRKPKPQEAPTDEPAPVAASDEAPVELALPTPDAVTEAPAATVEAPAEVVALAPTLPDHTQEVRAMHALLEASEQVRQAAEARTADAESQLRTVTNSVQEWQIRHREAEATITELAASLAGAEGRMSELHQRLSAAEAERDELVSQLDAVTSPTTS